MRTLVVHQQNQTFVNKSFAASLLTFGVNLCTSAAVFISQTFDSEFKNGGAIPDGSLNGWSDSRFVTVDGTHHISEIQVSFEITGGYNGDLYAYLTHGDGFAVLLNRVGVGETQGDPFGYADAGLNVTFTTSGAFENIHWYGGDGMPTGTYLPDGRAIEPLSSPADFDAASTDANLNSMIGLDPGGTWTLFVADVSSGGGQSAISSWGLQIVAVPEPAGAALVLGLAALGAMAVRRIK